MLRLNRFGYFSTTQLKTTLLLVIGLLILEIAVIAQSPYLKHFTIDDGLPGATIYNIKQDQKGYIWIATNNGICRYDGVSFRHYDSHFFYGNEVIHLANVDDMIWASDISGKIIYIKNDTVHLFDEKPILEDPGIKTMLQTDRNTVWIANRVTNHIYKMTKTTGGRLPYEIEKSFYLKNNDDVSLNLDQDGNLVVLWTNIYRYDTEKADFDTMSIDMSFVKKIKCSRNSVYNTLFHFGDDANFFLSNDVFQKALREQDIFFKEEFHGLRPYPCSSDSFLVSPQGLYRVNGNLNTVEELPWIKAKVNYIFEDRDKNIWLGTLDDGLYLLNNTAFIHYDKHNSDLPENYIYELSGDQNGAVFMGMKNGLLGCFYNDHISSIALVDTKREFYNIFTDSNKVLATVNEECYHLNYQAGQHLQDTKPYKHFDHGFKFSIKDGESNTWKATASYILLENDTIQIRFYINRAYSLFSDQHKARLWVGTTEGLFCLDKETEYVDHEKIMDVSMFRKNLHNAALDSKIILTYKTKELAGFHKSLKGYREYTSPPLEKFMDNNGAEIDFYVSAIGQTSDNTVWVSTHEGGVFFIKDSIITNITNEDGLSSNTCTNMFVDDADNIWVATNAGLNLISPDKTVRRITTDDGLVTNDVKAVYKHQDDIYVGSPKGLTVFKESSIKDTIAAPRVHITRFAVNNKDTVLQDFYGLNYDEDNISVDFVGISYKGKIQYKYRLEGLSEKWIPWPLNELSFIKLKPGKYTLSIKAVTNNGMESKEPAKIRFSIRPAWWKTRYFQACTLIGLLSLMFFIYNTRVNYIREKEAEKTAINKRFAELELQALRAQMNPHFVFNALNAIQSYILTKEKRVANRYLAKFASLMRMFLESSRSKYIAFEDELKLLNLYVELEQMRFVGKFESKIIVDPELEYGIDIPSLLLQPFVENAINHGLAYKEGKGTLSIDFRKGENMLICVIEDDGIGREAAAALKAKSYKSYKSRGMQIVEERLRVLQLLDQSKVNVKIIDKKNKAGIGEGTRVEIYIPYE